MIVICPPEIEKMILEAATKRNMEPESLVATIVEKELSDELALAPINGVAHDDDSDPEALYRAVAALMNRTPEQREAARELAIREFRPKNELPPDVSPLDVMPVIRGDETDEQVLEALKELS